MLDQSIIERKYNPSLPSSDVHESHCRDTSGGNDFHYEEVIKNFKWNIPEYFNFSRDVIDKYAAEQG